MEDTNTSAMNANDDSMADTLQEIKDSLGLLSTAVKDLYDANQNLKEELKRHFDVTVEHIRHDLEGANHDEIENLKTSRNTHDQRLRKIEHHLQLIG